MKTIRKSQYNICGLFSTTLRNRLGLRDDNEVLAYVEKQKNSIQRQQTLV